MTELIFQKGLMLIKHVCQSNVIAYIKGSAYRIHFWYMSKDDAINMMNGSNLVDKSGEM